MAAAALGISFLSIVIALASVLYTRKHANAAQAHAETAKKVLGLEEAREARADSDRRPRLWVEKTGASGGGGDAWSGIANVHNSGGSHAHQVKVDVRVDGERVGGSREVKDIPANESRTFNVDVSQPSRFGGSEAIEKVISFYAWDAAGHEAVWPPS